MHTSASLDCGNKRNQPLYCPSGQVVPHEAAGVHMDPDLKYSEEHSHTHSPLSSAVCAFQVAPSGSSLAGQSLHPPLSNWPAAHNPSTAGRKTTASSTTGPSRSEGHRIRSSGPGKKGPAACARKEAGHLNPPQAPPPNELRGRGEARNLVTSSKIRASLTDHREPGLMRWGNTVRKAQEGWR